MAKQLKLITYNIDGLPETLDLADLPWILKPLAWIYKLIKGTTIVTINNNTGRQENIEKIASYLESSDADIIALQEDFNFHDTMLSKLGNTYSCGTYLGGFDPSKIFSNTEWLTYFPLPRFKCDGLNIFTKNGKMSFSNEAIVSWAKSCGYFRHANDALTHKGFRYYQVAVDNETTIDVYIIHMDAYFYIGETVKAPRDLKARKAQLRQLVNHILYNGSNNPTIILGDTNSFNQFVWDVDNLKENLIDPINAIENLTIEEAIPDNFIGCDRIYIINNKAAKSSIRVTNCYLDQSISGLSDHIPLIAEIEVD